MQIKAGMTENPHSPQKKVTDNRRRFGVGAQKMTM
jgi:hypothetical protein